MYMKLDTLKFNFYKAMAGLLTFSIRLVTKTSGSPLVFGQSYICNPHLMHLSLVWQDRAQVNNQPACYEQGYVVDVNLMPDDHI